MKKASTQVRHKYITNTIFSCVDGSAELVWRRSFSHPIHGLWYGDLTRDGLSELAVLSMGGIHILQVNGSCGGKNGGV